MKNSADSGCIFTYRSYGAEWLFCLVSINMTPLTGLESANLPSLRVCEEIERGLSGSSRIFLLNPI
jgi:hypothetical protein